MRSAFTPLGSNDMAKDYVIDYGRDLTTSDSAYVWYRKWKSGWIEQGGSHNSQKLDVETVNLIIPFTNDRYLIQLTRLGDTEKLAYTSYYISHSKTLTSFDFSYTIGQGYAMWYACGY